jgi:phosphoenolpyruvate phosphomutase
MGDFVLKLRGEGELPKATQLRGLLQSDDLEFLLEAHNGLSARIVEEAGFKGIWASGFALSAQYGVRDNNEASWTQILQMLEFMSDATRIPILLDGDTGYGNFNSVRRLIKKLEQRNVAGVCIEDKVFPKTNSFIRDGRQPLADVDEFCGKIKAGKDAQEHDDFVLIARVEAFVVGQTLAEAIRRADAYHRAGADAVVIHSTKSTAAEVFAFQKEWGGRCPVVIIPTAYYSEPVSSFRERGFSLVIWANHVLRAATTAMQQVARTIHEQQSVQNVVDGIAPMTELFRLQQVAELLEAERRYLHLPASEGRQAG